MRRNLKRVGHRLINHVNPEHPLEIVTMLCAIYQAIKIALKQPVAGNDSNCLLIKHEFAEDDHCELFYK